MTSTEASRAAAAGDVARAAGTEWTNLVTAAVLGTDRRPLPVAGAGWEPTRPTPDAATELLDRAALVATARRAGVCPGPVPDAMVAPPVDVRPVCPPRATDALARMVRGEHDVLLPEWFERCAAAGMRPPPHLVPTLLLRGRRHPPLDHVVRRAVGPLAAWLADAMPELGLKQLPAPIPAGAAPMAAPSVISDSGAAVTTIVTVFLEGAATWAMAAQLRQLVAALDPKWLNALELELNRAPFRPATERTRVDLIGLVTTRRMLIESMPPADSLS